MKIKVSFSKEYESDFVYSNDEILNIAKNLLTFAVTNNFSKDYSCSYNYSFDVMLCNNEFIHKINNDYRKIDKPTDVITFSLFADSQSKIITDNTINLGQIIISADKVTEQSVENQVTEKFEFLNLLSHGILHLIGFDHKDDNSLNDMLELQSKLIESIQNVKI